MGQSSVFWAFIFLLILLLTQATNILGISNKAFLLGLPTWLWYFIGIHLLLIIALYFFSKLYLKEEE